jgi:signal peptidase I
MTASLPAPWPTVIDWIVTIVVAVGAVLAIKQWVVNPYRIPSASMEPTLHCAGSIGCLSNYSDRVLANRFIFRFRDPERGEIVVFETPDEAFEKCGAGGTFVKRVIGLPGETLVQRNNVLLVNGRRLSEPYLANPRNLGKDFPQERLGPDEYFMMGDNRTSSCDSRDWGAVPRGSLIGPVFAVYWPPQRIGFR